LRKAVNVALYLISYDISEKDKEEYEPLWAALRQMGATKILLSQWVVKGAVGDAARIYDKLSPIITSIDRLLVQEILQDCSWDRLMISDSAYSELVTKNARG
jgi:hypothetical protein